jgi:hypothetical protein
MSLCPSRCDLINAHLTAVRICTGKSARGAKAPSNIDQLVQLPGLHLMASMWTGDCRENPVVVRILARRAAFKRSKKRYTTL